MSYSFIASTFVLCLIAFYFGRVASKWRDFEFIEDFKKRGQIALLKPIYIFVALFVGAHILILFFSLLGEILAILTNKNVVDVRDLALAFIGSVSAIGALFGVYLAILRSEENKRQNDVAEEQSKTAIKQSETAIKQSKTTIKQNKIANDQRKIANEQANTAEQGLISDRINKAVENLGRVNQKDEPVLEIRIGAIYALERIAKDSARDHIQIMELFCAYIRTNSPNDNQKTPNAPLREDIKIILNIIRRRHQWEQGENRLQIEKNQGMDIDLYKCYLKGAELYGANFSNANFYSSNLQGAWFNNTDLSRARLLEVNINGASLTGAKTNGAYAQRGDFSGCKTLNQEQINQMFLGMDVKLGKDEKTNEDLIHPQKDTKYYKKYNSQVDFDEACREWREETGN